MFFIWLKRYLPRSLYGRAALILLVPVVTLQLAVTIVFIQRHFEDVTRQMTRNLVLDLKYVQHVVDGAATVEEARTRLSALEVPLALTLRLPSDEPAGNAREFYDLSGKTVITSFATYLPEVRAVDLVRDPRGVHLRMATAFGDMQAHFARNRVSAANPHQLLVLTIFLAILMTVVSFIFLRNQLRPIKRLASAAESFGRGRADPFRPSGATEVRAAGHAFLDMRARIERQIEQRTLMLSGVSHDLRTPLTRLTLGLSMMDEDDDVRALKQDVRDMQRLLDEFLAYARGDALEATEMVDPVALARHVVEAGVRAELPVTLGRVSGAGEALMRPAAITRALENLIGNAVRYGSHARVGVTVLDRSIRFTVEDDGPGIPEDQRDEALKPFTRLEPARNQNRTTGVGLGLSITADIARGHGGTLRLGESEDMGGLKADLVIAR